MTEAERLAYQHEVRSAAKRLGVQTHGNVEAALTRHAVEKVRDWMSAHGQPSNLTDLLHQFATSLNLEIVEISGEDDLKSLLQRIPATREPVLARLEAELDDRTDAVVLQRQNRDDWEMPYLAAINCRGWHGYRRYFSKWHEVVHLLLDGAQLRFAFRKTRSKRKHPEEILVDKIAGALAFYPALFDPVFAREIQASRRLKFDVVERVRAAIVPEASRHATLLACIRACPYPACFVTARLQYKRAEERQLNDLLANITEEDRAPQPKLRVDEVSASPSVQQLGIRLHQRMEVPEKSAVTSAFSGPEHSLCHNRERLEIWRTSKGGPIGSGPVEVEAIRFGEEVWCIVSFLPGACGKLVPTKSGDHRRTRNN